MLHGASVWAQTEASGGWPAGELTFQVQADHHSDPIAIANFDDDRAPLDPRRGRNLVYLRDEARAAVALQLWPHSQDEWAVLWRASGTIVASADALRLKTAVDLKQSPAAGQRFDVDGRYLGFKGWGVAFEHRSGALQHVRPDEAPVPGWGWSLSAQMLRLTQLRWVDVKGLAIGAPATTLGYEVDAGLHQLDERTQWPSRRAYASSGLGLLFGGGLGWCDPAWCVHLQAEDLGRLYWNGLPRDDASLSTDVLAYDDGGYLVYKRSLVEGRLSQPRTRLSAPWSVTARADAWVRSDVQLGAAVQQLQGFGALPRIEARWQAGPDWTWRADWRFHERRLGLGLDGRWRALQWGLAAGFDRLDDQARSQSLRAWMGWGWN